MIEAAVEKEGRVAIVVPHGVLCRGAADENMEKILNAYEAREEQKKYTHLASYDELKESDFNVNIPRYVDTLEEEAEIDIEAVQKKSTHLKLNWQKYGARWLTF